MSDKATIQLRISDCTMCPFCDVTEDVWCMMLKELVSHSGPVPDHCPIRVDRLDDESIGDKPDDWSCNAHGESTA